MSYLHPNILKKHIKTFLLSKQKSSIAFYVFLTLGLIFNIIYALGPPTFLHPDEVYQTLEVAHKLVYGYGIISWEWIVGSFPTTSNPAGFGPIRSLITPLIFATIFVIGEGLHLNYWNQTLPLMRVLLYLNFFLGLYLASKILQEIDPSKSNVSARLFLIVSLFYYEFVLYGSKTITNTLILPMMCFPLLIWIKSDIDKRKDNWALEGIGGFLVGVSIWLRPDSGIIMAFFVILYLDRLRIRKIFTFGIGFLLSALLNGLLDLMYYGSFFVSFPNFLKFNSQNQSFFGVEPFGWYFDTIILGRQTFFYLFILITVVILAFIIKIIYKAYFKKNFKIESQFTKEFLTLIKLTLWSIIVLFWWETQPHKEARFMVTWEITYVLLGAYTITLSARYLTNFLKNNSNKIKQILYKLNIRIPSKFYNLNLFVIMLIVIFTPFAIFDINESTNQPWNNFNDILEAFVWVGQQQNLTGVAIIMPYWYSGGYSYLHRNVSLYQLDPSTSVFIGSMFYPKILASEHLINYLVIPTYRYSEPGLQDLHNATMISGFTLVQTIMGSTDIWYYP